MSDPMTPKPNERKHLAAMERATRLGFVRAGHLTEVIHCERHHQGVVETYTARNFEEAAAARYLATEYPHGGVLWETTGTVEEVITALLGLAVHGERGAPHLIRRPSSDLWLP